MVAGDDICRAARGGADAREPAQLTPILKRRQRSADWRDLDMGTSPQRCQPKLRVKSSSSGGRASCAVVVDLPKNTAGGLNEASRICGTRSVGSLADS